MGTDLPAHLKWMLRAASAGVGGGSASAAFPGEVPAKQLPELLTLIHWHRCGPAVLAGIRAGAVPPLPPPWDGRLKQLVDDGTRQNFALLQQLIQIDDAFKQQNIGYLTLKGLPLSEQAFGNIGFRFSRDIDLLIAAADYSATCTLLRDLGFQPKPPQIPFKPPLRWRYTNGEIWQKDQILLDLHCGFDEPGAPFPLAVSKAIAEAGQVHLGNRTFPVLEQNTLVLFLANHAAKHLWMRFFWLLDLGGLIQRQALDWQRISTMAAEMGLERRLWMTLQLMSDLFGWPVPKELENLGHRLPDVGAWLEDWRGFTLEQRNYANSWSIQIPPSRVYRWSLRLTDRPADRLKLIFAWFFRPLAADVLSLPLPVRLRFLYVIWRPIRLVLRACGLGNRALRNPDG